MLWYGDWNLPLGKFTSPLVGSYIWIYCVKPGWGACLIFSCCCDVSPRVRSCLLLVFLEELKILEESTCEGPRREFNWIVILCKMYLNFDVLERTSSFLTGSFPMELWTRMNNRGRKRLWKPPCIALMWFQIMHMYVRK